ncbi:hypothetical protein ABLB69_00195 [Xenorhabdus khoisanae]|uniref:hypothetical protein n=1 Tax=Xenorhabdus khoisanae TaxID=880157 RepID=UPI000ACE3608|nr:hypothetical protein [Xenorhabdus khoisanae]
MYTKKRNKKNFKSVVIQLTRSVSFDIDYLSSQKRISKTRERYIQDISSKALSHVNN